MPVDSLGNPIPAIPEEAFKYLSKKVVNWNGHSYQMVNSCDKSHPAECKDGHWYRVTEFHWEPIYQDKDWKDFIDEEEYSPPEKVIWKVDSWPIPGGQGMTPPLNITGYSVVCTITVNLPIGNNADKKTFKASGHARQGYDFREQNSNKNWNTAFGGGFEEAAKNSAKEAALKDAYSNMDTKLFDGGYWHVKTEDQPYEYEEDLYDIFSNSGPNAPSSGGGSINADINNSEPDEWIDMLYSISKYTDPDTGLEDPDRAVKHFAFFNPRTGEYIYDAKDLPEGAKYEYSQARYDYQRELIEKGWIADPRDPEGSPGLGVSLNDQTTLGAIPAPGSVVVEGSTENSVIVVEEYEDGEAITVFGCMDSAALNYDPRATLNNPSDCEYPKIDAANKTITGSPSNNLFDSLPKSTEAPPEDFDPSSTRKHTTVTSEFSAIGGPKWVREYDLTDPATVAGTIYGTCADMEKVGALYIGDLRFVIPPVSMHFSMQNTTMDIPSMRTKGDPTFVNNKNIPRVNFTLYFNGERAINTELRPLMAMFQNAPFSTVQNTTIYDNWVARQDLIAKKDSEDDDAQIYSTRCEPLPAYLESINFTTVPGFPNTIQAHVSLVFMNAYPYGISPLFWKFTDDAFKEAIDAAVRYDSNNVLINIPNITRKASGTNEEGEPSQELNEIQTHFTYLLGGSGQHYKITKEDELADPTSVTPYPQYSWPYQKLYKNCLSEYPDAYKSAKTVNPEADWPLYKREDNHNLYLTYHSAKKLSTVESNFAHRMEAMNKRFENLDMLGLVIANGISGTTSDFFGTVKDLEIGNFLSDLLNYMSLSQTIADAKEIIADLQNTVISEINQQILIGQGQPLLDDNGNPIAVSPVSPMQILDSNGKIKNPIDDLFEQLSLSYAQSQAQGRCSVDPDVNLLQDACLEAGGNWTPSSVDDDTWKNNMKDIIDIVINNFTREYENRVQDLSSVHNFQEVGVKFGWDDSALIGTGLKDLAAVSYTHLRAHET